MDTIHGRLRESEADIGYLRQRIASLESDLAEQCRLHGAGSEREARKDARIAELENELTKANIELLNRTVSNAEAAKLFALTAANEKIAAQAERIAELERISKIDQETAANNLKHWNEVAAKCVELERQRDGMLAALKGVIEWDKARKFLIPYRVRDPIHAAIAAAKGGAA